jgi:hypothetical protein
LTDRVKKVVINKVIFERVEINLECWSNLLQTNWLLTTEYEQTDLF